MRLPITQRPRPCVGPGTGLKTHLFAVDSPLCSTLTCKHNHVRNSSVQQGACMSSTSDHSGVVISALSSFILLSPVIAYERIPKVQLCVMVRHADETQMVSCESLVRRRARCLSTV